MSNVVKFPVHPRAHSVDIKFCGDIECDRPHVVLFDEAGGIIADFVCPDLNEDGSGFAFRLYNEAIKFKTRKRLREQRGK